MSIYDEAVEKEVYKEHISHEAIRLIAKEKLHWSGGRIEVLRYIDEQQAKEERAKKVEELLEIYKNAWICDFMSSEEERQAKNLVEELK